MRRFRNLTGTIMLHDEELVRFKIVNGDVTSVQKLSANLPYEFKFKLSDEQAVLYFLDDRVVPETRIGLQKDLERAGIPYFDPDRILMYNNGNTVTDEYWVKFETGPQSYKEMRDRVLKLNRELGTW